jgi:hypothetical protein
VQGAPDVYMRPNIRRDGKWREYIKDVKGTTHVNYNRRHSAKNSGTLCRRKK